MSHNILPTHQCTQEQTHDASACSDTESGIEGGHDSSSLINSYASHPPSCPRKRKSGRPCSRSGTLRRVNNRKRKETIPWTAIETMLRADDQATRSGKPLDVFVTVRWAYSKHDGENPAVMVNRFFSAAQAFFKRLGGNITYISTLENPQRGDDAFHLHMLVYIPSGMNRAFKQWLEKYVGGEKRAVDIRPRIEQKCYHQQTRLNYMMKACHWLSAEPLGRNNKHINPSGLWDFKQGQMPPGLRRWRISADLQTKPPANASYRSVPFTDVTGAEIREARLMRGLSQQQLADLAGLNRNTIIRLERFDRIPESSSHALRYVEKALRR